MTTNNPTLRQDAVVVRPTASFYISSDEDDHIPTSDSSNHDDGGLSDSHCDVANKDGYTASSSGSSSSSSSDSHDKKERGSVVSSILAKFAAARLQELRARGGVPIRDSSTTMMSRLNRGRERASFRPSSSKPQGPNEEPPTPSPRRSSSLPNRLGRVKLTAAKPISTTASFNLHLSQTVDNKAHSASLDNAPPLHHDEDSNNNNDDDDVNAVFNNDKHDDGTDSGMSSQRLDDSGASTEVTPSQGTLVQGSLSDGTGVLYPQEPGVQTRSRVSRRLLSDVEEVLERSQLLQTSDSDEEVLHDDVDDDHCEEEGDARPRDADVQVRTPRATPPKVGRKAGDECSHLVVMNTSFILNNVVDDKATGNGNDDMVNESQQQTAADDSAAALCESHYHADVSGNNSSSSSSASSCTTSLSSSLTKPLETKSWADRSWADKGWETDGGMDGRNGRRGMRGYHYRGAGPHYYGRGGGFPFNRRYPPGFPPAPFPYGVPPYMRFGPYGPLPPPPTPPPPPPFGFPMHVRAWRGRGGFGPRHYEPFPLHEPFPHPHEPFPHHHHEPLPHHYSNHRGHSSSRGFTRGRGRGRSWDYSPRPVRMEREINHHVRDRMEREGNHYHHDNRDTRMEKEGNHHHDHHNRETRDTREGRARERTTIGSAQSDTNEQGYTRGRSLNRKPFDPQAARQRHQSAPPVNPDVSPENNLRLRQRHRSMSRGPRRTEQQEDGQSYRSRQLSPPHQGATQLEQEILYSPPFDRVQYRSTPPRPRPPHPGREGRSCYDKHVRYGHGYSGPATPDRHHGGYEPPTRGRHRGGPPTPDRHYGYSGPQTPSRYHGERRLPTPGRYQERRPRDSDRFYGSSSRWPEERDHAPRFRDHQHHNDGSAYHTGHRHSGHKESGQQHIGHHQPEYSPYYDQPPSPPWAQHAESRYQRHSRRQLDGTVPTEREHTAPDGYAAEIDNKYRHVDLDHKYRPAEIDREYKRAPELDHNYRQEDMDQKYRQAAELHQDYRQEELNHDANHNGAETAAADELYSAGDDDEEVVEKNGPDAIDRVIKSEYRDERLKQDLERFLRENASRADRRSRRRKPNAEYTERPGSSRADDDAQSSSSKKGAESDGSFGKLDEAVRGQKGSGLDGAERVALTHTDNPQTQFPVPNPHISRTKKGSSHSRHACSRHHTHHDMQPAPLNPMCPAFVSHQNVYQERQNSNQERQNTRQERQKTYQAGQNTYQDRQNKTYQQYLDAVQFAPTSLEAPFAEVQPGGQYGPAVNEQQFVVNPHQYWDQHGDLVHGQTADDSWQEDSVIEQETVQVLNQSSDDYNNANLMPQQALVMQTGLPGEPYYPHNLPTPNFPFMIGADGIVSPSPFLPPPGTPFFPFTPGFTPGLQGNIFQFPPPPSMMTWMPNQLGGSVNVSQPPPPSGNMQFLPVQFSSSQNNQFSSSQNNQFTSSQNNQFTGSQNNQFTGSQNNQFTGSHHTNQSSNHHYTNQTHHHQQTNQFTNSTNQTNYNQHLQSKGKQPADPTTQQQQYAYPPPVPCDVNGNVMA